MKKILILLLPVLLVTTCTRTKNPTYFVQGVAKPRISLNGSWKINLNPPERFWETATLDESWREIEVPGECMMQGFPIRHDVPFVYKKAVLIPADYRGKQILLQFDGVYSYARVWANGNPVGDHHGGFTSWKCDITPHVRAGEEAWITLEVTDRADEISYGSGYAKHQIGGILRDVHLLALPGNYLQQVKIETDLDDNYLDATLKVKGKLTGRGDHTRIIIELFDSHNRLIPLETEAVDVAGSGDFLLLNGVAEPEKWDAEHPNLYDLKIKILANGTLQWMNTYRIGFREVEVKGNRLLVNGRPVKLRGANRHDIHPTLGRVSTRPYEERDVQLAREANMNFIRTSHYPPTDSFLGLCDEYGLYVEDESAVCFVGSHRTEEYAPGASESDPEFTARYLSQLDEMLTSHWNHPSVIIWSIGNENSYGSNFKTSYDRVKELDTTRPVIYSYPGNVPEFDIAYDILSMHYPGTNGDMNQRGKVTRAFGYDEMPVIFDEWAHVACYNNFTLKEDPNIRDFWGRSLDLMWQALLAAEGGLGGAIWGLIDETFLLPVSLPGFNRWWGKIDEKVIPAEYTGHTVGYGEWGIFDTWRRKKPEFWNTKKAYSPIRIEQTVFNNHQTGSPLDIPVLNRFDHTDLSEISAEWTYLDRTKKLTPVKLQPHQRGTLTIPLKKWDRNEPIDLSFFDSRGRLIDRYTLRKTSDYVAKPPGTLSPGKISVTEKSDLLILSLSNGVTIDVDKTTGLIRDVESHLGKRIFSGPFPNVRTRGAATIYSSHKINQHGKGWKLAAFSHHLDGATFSMKVWGSCPENLRALFLISIHEDGRITVEYSYEGIPDEFIREAGIRFVCGEMFDSISWKRRPYWSFYPENHLSTASGKAELFPKKLNRYRTAPQKDWLLDSKSFYYSGTNDETPNGALTSIARATKENILEYDLMNNDVEILSVSAAGDVACRLEKGDGILGLFINNLWDYVDLSWGNFQKNIKATGRCEGKIELKIK